MPFDAIFISNLCKELNTACGSRIDKIFQPQRDELVITLRGAGYVKKLLISVRSGSSRISFTTENFENPAVPPMFCMLMRKHLTGGKLISVTQDSLERMLTLCISATDEMGERRNLRLVTEFIGNKSNIILVNEDGRILDAIKRSDIETNTRLIQPGAIYTLPPTQDKKSPFDDAVLEDILAKKDLPLSSAILESVAGVSPLVAREIAYSIGNDIIVRDMNDSQKSSFFLAFSKFLDMAENGTPYMLLATDGTPKDFSFLPINQYGSSYTLKQFGSMSELLDAFYSERDAASRIKRSAAEVLRVVTSTKARLNKKLFIRKKEKEKCKDREKYRIYGELIKANIALIKSGSPFADVPNYYDENLSTIRIPLDPALSPQACAAKYFKEYRKLCSAEQTLYTLIADCESEQAYIQSVEDALLRAESMAEILDIHDELVSTGYIKKQKNKAVKHKSLPPRKYMSSDGFLILVGRNNAQNDTLTLRTAKKDDIWLHTKNIHGSHVIIVCDGKTVPDNTILEAASLAAFHSQAKNSSQVPVDYTIVKNVKKPAGARPGMVIYKTNNTVFVAPKDMQEK